MGGAADEIKIGQKGGADGRTKKRLEWTVGSPAIEGATDGAVAGLEIGGGEKLLVNDFGLEGGQEFLVENLDYAIGVGGAFSGPIDGSGIGRGID